MNIIYINYFYILLFILYLSTYYEIINIYLIIENRVNIMYIKSGIET